MGLLKEIWILLTDMAPYLLFGFGIAGFLHIVFPRDTIYKHLSNRNIYSVIKAALFGVPLPLCSCGVIPVAAHIRKSGAGKGATLSFLISTPTSGIDSIFATYSLLGPIFAIFRPIAAFISGIVAGIFANNLPDEQNRIHEDDKFSCNICDNDEPHTHSFGEKISKMFSYGYFELVEDIAKWLVIGIITGGLISFFIPNNFIGTYLGNPLIAYPIMLAISIPMYVCATGSIPIAASLIMKGMTPGAGLIFLIGGPATNTATISFVGGKLGKKVLVIYLATITIASVVFGILLDFIWLKFAGETMFLTGKMQMLPTWLKSASVVILLVLIVKAFYAKYSNKQEVSGMGKIFSVPDMSCQHCVKTIDSALRKIDGVVDVIIDLSTKKVEVDGNVDNDTIMNAIINAGYTPEKLDD
ncbi:SO_0444 family Cu/Zn efflux transporter [bacterium]|nr:SO_0444 family Cu/Zn efflux transporter [bacterium]